MTTEQKQKLKEITTIEIVDAIDELCALHAAYAGCSKEQWPQTSLDKREMARRTIADGLRYHSGNLGMVVGEQ